MNKKTKIILLLTLILVVSSIIFYISLNSNNDNSPDQNNSEDENDQENHIPEDPPDEPEVPDEPPDDSTNESITPVLTVELDRINKTITIVSIEEGTDLIWSNVEVLVGTATIPEGTIDEGDMITNCTEILDFNWIPTNEIFLHVEFVRGE